jgi:hypothetical protein
MPSLRRPQQTVLSGVGVAGAVLAAVVVTFALASGIVTYNLTSSDPLPRPSGTLVLAPIGARVTTAKPLVLRRARAATAKRPSAPAVGAVARVSAKPDGEAVALARHGRGSRAPTKPQHADDAPPAPAQAAPDRGAPQPLLAPVGDAVGATGQAVGATTDSLARRLDTVPAAVGTTADVLRTTVDGSGRVVRRLLGDSPGH